MDSLNPRRPNSLVGRKFSRISSARFFRLSLISLCLVAGFYFVPALLSKRETLTTPSASTLPTVSGLTGAPSVTGQVSAGERVETQAGRVADGRVKEAYGRLPIAFTRNAGQHDEKVKYTARGGGFQLFLTSDEAVLALNKPAAEQKGEDEPGVEQEAAEVGRQKQGAAVLRMKLLGADGRARVTGEEEMAAKSNYFVGADAESWQTGVAMFEKVRYHEVYPGIDVVYYGNQRQLEYDFILAPRVDPKRIKLAFSGARKVHLDAGGDLLLETGNGTVRQQRPVIYQLVEGRRQEVAGQYAISGRGEIGFKVGAYDRSLPLVIDPILSYSTFFGGTDADQALAIALDAQNNAYVTGQTFSTDFPTKNPFQATKGDDIGGNDAFVLKLNPSGTALVYATYIGGNGSDIGNAIAVDAAGNAYITGLTGSGSFPRTIPTLQDSKSGGIDAFVTKLNATGDALVYSSFLGGENFEQGYGIAVNAVGEAHVTGRTDSTTFLRGIPMEKQGSSAYKSSDAGVTWSASNNGLTDPNIASIIVDPTNAGTLYAAGTSGVFKSTDGGNLWRLTGQSSVSTSPRGASTVAVDPSNPLTLYAGASQGGVFKSTDGGNLWDRSENGLQGFAFFVNHVAIDPNNTSTLYLATIDSVYKSVNGGSSWAKSANGIPSQARQTNKIIFDPSDTKILYAATQSGVFKSLNSGASWTAASNGLNASPGSVVLSVLSLAISPSSPSTIYAGTNTGVFKSTNSGQSWVQANDGLRVQTPLTGALYIPSVRSIAVNPATPDTLYAGSSQGGVFKSMDGGANWTASNNGLSNIVITSLAIDHTTPSTLYASTNSGADAFVIKINAGGTHFDYLRYLGGSENDLARGIALDPGGNAYLTGTTSSPNFPVLQPLQAVGGGALSDAFVTKLGLDGSTLYATYLGGSGNDQGLGIAVSAAGNAYVTGSTNSTNFPTAGPRQTSNTALPISAAFVSKLGVNGDSLDYSVYHGGNSTEQGSAIALDPAGNAYVTGTTSSPDFPVLNAVQPSYGSGGDAFVLKLSQNSEVVYSTYLGGFGSDQGFGIAADANGIVYVAGSTASPDFPTASPLQPTHMHGGDDAFIARLAPSVDLSLTMTDAPDPVVLGGNLTYTLKVTNVGELTATGVRLTDTLPAGAALVSTSTTAGTCSGTTVVNCELGTLGSGASATVTIVITPPAIRTINNTASVTTSESEENTANNTATQATLVDFAELSLSAASFQGVVNPGGRVTYVLVVSNNAGTAAPNVALNVELPSGLNIVSCTASGGTCGGTGSSRAVVFPTLAANASHSVVIVADVNGDVAEGTTLTVTASASSSLPDPEPSNNAASANVTVSSSSVQSKSNGQIAFTLDGIYVMNDDGTNVKKIYSEAEGRFSLATWSPDGTKIAFVNEISTSSFVTFEIRVVNADGSEPRVLSNNATLDSRPTWSPNSAFVGFVARNRLSIQAVNVTGKPAATTLYNTDTILDEVAWSPDGMKLLYSSANAELRTVNIDGGSPKLLDTDPDTFDRNPLWSTDGTKIIFLRGFYSSQSGSTTIYTMNADGTNPQPLPNSRDSSARRPVFSPDGTMIAYEAPVSINGSGFLSQGILKMNADGTNITRIPADGQAGRAPSWQPLPATAPPPTPVPTFKISGRVTPPSGLSSFISGYVRLDLTGSRTASAYPDSNGDYSFTLPAGGDYTVTPVVNPFYNFSPGSYTFNNLSADQLNANFTTTLITYSVSGRVTDTNGEPLRDVEITLSREGSLRGTRRTGADGTYIFDNLDYGRTHTVYVSPSSRVDYEFEPDARSFGLTQSQVVNFVGTPKNSFQFDNESFVVGEGDGRVTITVLRAGPGSSIAAPASVTVYTFDDPAAVPCDPTLKRPDGTPYPQGTAYARCDYATKIETLHFAPGVVRKTLTIPIIDDAHVEGTETFSINFSNAVGAAIGRPRAGRVVIEDNDSGTAENPTLTTSFFVRQHYLDFLSREPEADEPWSGVLNRCANPFNRDPSNASAACDRLIVSQSFFGSPEFRLKGFFIYNFYRVAFDRRPEYAEIIPDMSAVSGATAAEVYARRAALTVSFTERAEFKTRYDGVSDTAYVNSLLDRYNLQEIRTPDPQNPEGATKVVLTRTELINRLGATGTAQALTRAQVLRAIVESEEVGAIEYNGAFVAMQYYGYLRRTPEESGYQAWLRVITQDPNNIRIMVDGFVNSTEYKLRFGRP